MYYTYLSQVLFFSNLTGKIKFKYITFFGHLCINTVRLHILSVKFCCALAKKLNIKDIIYFMRHYLNVHIRIVHLVKHCVISVETK